MSITDDYILVRTFLAHQARALDAADADAFAATFTEQGVLRHASRSEVLQGRAAIAAATRATASAHASAAHRHWFDQFIVEVGPAEIRASYYALTTLVGPNGTVRLLPTCLVKDVLHRTDDGALAVHDRLVTRDDLALSTNAELPR